MILGGVRGLETPLDLNINKLVKVQIRGRKSLPPNLWWVCSQPSKKDSQRIPYKKKRWSQETKYLQERTPLDTKKLWNINKLTSQKENKDYLSEDEEEKNKGEPIIFF